MTDLHAWKVIAVIVLVTAMLRFLPFLVFGNNRRTPPVIEKLGRILPYAAMGMLVVYCLRNIHFMSAAGFVPPVVSALVVGVLYVWKRNTLFSIICGTVCHMILVQLVF